MSKQRGYIYWVVKRWFDSKLIYFGNYKTRAEAQARVYELEQNNWEGLLNE